jgi:hypothetical protein
MGAARNQSKPPALVQYCKILERLQSLASGSPVRVTIETNCKMLFTSSCIMA